MKGGSSVRNHYAPVPATAIALLFLMTCLGFAASPAGAAQRRGLLSIGDSELPAPADAQVIPLPGADFEGDGKSPPGWGIGAGEIVAADDAPQGRAYCRIPLRQGLLLISPHIEGVPGSPHYLSFWLKSSTRCWAAIEFGSDETMRTAGDHYPGTPSTGNQWRRVGYYFWLPLQCRTVRFHVRWQQETAEGDFIAVDDVRLRTASEAEMSAAYEAERAHLPPYDATPRPDDGKNLALSVAKWEGRAGLPGKPFLIWAVGSSWTNFQGDGYPLMRAIRERFPDAPPIVYKKHAGSGTPWDYARGWVRQFVAADQPDLILTYTNGTPEGLDALLGEIRRSTTADVIVPSLHFFQGSKLTPEAIERFEGVPLDVIREICRKHGAEFVENRRELAEYLQKNDLEPEALLGDVVHQNQHGRIRIWDNICRHIAKPERFTYAPESRQRRIAVAPPAASTGTEQVAATGPWTVSNGILRTDQKGARLTVRFTGNRIDLLGRRTPGGGTVRVLIDGAPADQAPAFQTTFIRPKPAVWPRALKGPGPGDVAPHAVELRDGVVPQTWTITMTSDTGDYRLEGSVTGPDGEGNLAEPFLSRSGQIAIDPKLWRHGRAERKDGVVYGNGTGDTFTFDVERSAAGSVSFRSGENEASEGRESFSQPLAQNLVNGPHTLEVISNGDGRVSIEAVYVFQPPGTREP
jgi:hypothetical protein